jgi:Adenylate and Guanylate cyclase catalytic domain
MRRYCSKAARMESTGKRDMLQISQATADILCSNGKHHWIVRRGDSVEAKGIGRLKTYWLHPSVNKKGSATGESELESSETGVESNSLGPLSDKDIIKNHRLVDWMVQLLLDHINKVVSISFCRKAYELESWTLSDLNKHPLSSPTRWKRTRPQKA